MRVDQGLDVDHLKACRVCHWLRHDDCLHLVTRATQRACQRWEQRTGSQHCLRTRIFQQIRAVIGRQKRIHRNRNQTCVERAKKADWPVQTIMHQKQNPLFTAQAQRPQCLSQTSNPVLQFTKGQRPRIIDKGGFVRALRIAVQQVLPDIESFGWTTEVRLRLQTGWLERNRYGLRHAVSPRVNVRPTLTVGSRTRQA